ncbi:MAG: hypothetical protein ABUS57_00505 [Pseudomonadota bacterium]
MLRQLLFAALALPWLCVDPAHAQDAPSTTKPASVAPTTVAPIAVAPATGAPASAAPSTEAAPTNEDTIVVQGYRDRAMSAFLRGDFVTAEREFGNNLSCIQRIETLNSFAFEQARTDELRADASAAMGPPGAAVTAPAPMASYNIHSRRARVPERTCEGPDWQLYMMGLSQIGQGKLRQAKDTLYRVVRSSNNQYLFDAHYRVGLLELMDGNINEADSRLTHLRQMQHFCDARGEACEIKAELDYEVAYLAYAISAARRGQLRLR